MKRFLPGFLLITSCISQAANWIPITQDVQGGAFFIDKETIEINTNNNIVTIWEKREGNLESYEGQPVTSYISKTEYFCENRTYKTLFMALYNFNKVINSGEIDGANNPVVPGTSGETMYKVVCSLPDLKYSEEQTRASDFEANRDTYNDQYKRGIIEFLSRPENKLFKEDSYFNILTKEALKISNTTAGSMMNPVDLLEAARFNALKIIADIKTTSKAPSPKKPRPISKTTKNSVFL